MVQKTSRKRKRSKTKTSNVSGAYKMAPLEIRPLISQRYILASENAQLYDNLFQSLAAVFKPKNVPQWLRLKEFHDLMWEKQRMSRIKPAIVDSAQKGVVLSMLESLPGDVKMQLGSPIMSHYMTAWFKPGKQRHALERLLKMFNYSKDAIDGMAFIERIGEIETLEKLQAANEMRQQMLYRQLDEETAIPVLPNKANDNDDGPAQLTHHQDDDQEAVAGDHEEAQSEHKVEALETADAGDAEATAHEEDASDRGEANRHANGHEQSEDVDVEDAFTDEGADESDEEAA